MTIDSGRQDRARDRRQPRHRARDRGALRRRRGRRDLFLSRSGAPRPTRWWRRRAAGLRVTAEQVDVRDAAACEAAVERLIERGERIDVLVTAGVIRDDLLAGLEARGRAGGPRHQRPRRVQHDAGGGPVHGLAAAADRSYLSSVAAQGRPRPEQLRREQRRHRTPSPGPSRSSSLRAASA